MDNMELEETYTDRDVINVTLWAISHTQQKARLHGVGEVIAVHYDDGFNVLPSPYDEPDTEITFFRYEDNVDGKKMLVFSDTTLGNIKSVSWPLPEALEAGVKHWLIEVEETLRWGYWSLEPVEDVD